MEDVRRDYVEASDAALVVAIGRYQQAALAEASAGEFSNMVRCGARLSRTTRCRSRIAGS